VRRDASENSTTFSLYSLKISATPVSVGAVLQRWIAPGEQLLLTPIATMERVSLSERMKS
jgi:uncharacterized protein involved in propanediol utilization